MKGFPVRPVPVEAVAEQLTVVRRRASQGGVHRPVDRHRGVRVPARAPAARRLAAFRARPADRAAGGAGHPVPHDQQRRAAGRGGHRRRARRRRGRRLRPVQLVGARPAHRGHAGARHRAPAARGDPRGADQRHADLRHRLARGRDQPDHRDAGRRGRRARGRRCWPRSGAARPRGGRRPEPPDGRPARPDGRGPGRGAGPRRAAEWLDRTRALRGEIERVDDALAQAEESVRLNPRQFGPRQFRAGQPRGRAAGRRSHAGAGGDGYAGAGSFGRGQRAHRQRAQPGPGGGNPGPAGRRDRRAVRRGPGLRAAARGRAGARALAGFAAEPITEVLEDHLEEAHRQQDELADLLSTDPAEHPEGWQLRGEILAHVDRLRSELEPERLPRPAPRKPHWGERHRAKDAGAKEPERGAPGTRDRAAAAADLGHPAGRARRTASRVRARRGR